MTEEKLEIAKNLNQDSSYLGKWIEDLKHINKSNIDVIQGDTESLAVLFKQKIFKFFKRGKNFGIQIDPMNVGSVIVDDHSLQTPELIRELTKAKVEITQYTIEKLEKIKQAADNKFNDL